MSRRVSSPIFVGRRRELDRLTALLADRSPDRSIAVVVSGEAGVGKSRLAGEAARIAMAGGARVLRGGAIQLRGGSLPYAPIVEALRPVARSLGREECDRLIGRGTGDLARILPDLDPAARPRAEPRAIARTRLFEAILSLLRALASEAPVVLVVEDLQWADRATLDVLTFLAHNVADDAVVLVGTCREEALTSRGPIVAFLADLDRTGRAETLTLEPFARPELDTMLAGILGKEPDVEQAESIYARSCGNAYFAEELLALGPGARLPATLREVLLARVDSSRESGRLFLDVASVASAPFDPRTVELVGGLSPGQAAAALSEALDRQMIVAAAGSIERFGFRHALLAEAIYDSLEAGRRRELHAAWARALEAAVGEKPEIGATAEIADHWSRAGDPAQTLRARVRAGVTARSAYAFADSLEQLSGALAIWPAVADPERSAGLDRAALLELAADTAFLAGEHGEADRWLGQALEQLDELSDPVVAGRLHARRATIAVRRHDAGRAASEFAAAERLVPADPPTAARALVLEGLARSAILGGGDLDVGVALAREAADVARRAGAGEAEADALATLGVGEAALGYPEEALAVLARARDLALSLDDPEAVTRAWINRSAVLEGDAAVEEALAGAAWADAHGLARGSGGWGRGAACLAMWELGRWVEMERTLGEIQVARTASPNRFLAEVCRAFLAVGRGRGDDAVAAQAAAARWSGGPWTQPSWDLVMARLAILVLGVRGELEAARELASQAVRSLTSQPNGVIAMHASLLGTALRLEADRAAAGRLRHDRAMVADAERTGAAILEVARATNAAVTGPAARIWQRPAGAAAYCEAEFTRLTGASDPASWREAAEMSVAGVHAHLRPYALMREAEALLAHRRERERAAALLREAGSLASEMGALPIAEAVAGVAARARVDLAGSGNPGPGGESGSPGRDRLAGFGLTPREREVLLLLAVGRTNREIAGELFVTEKTASVHVSNVLGKLGVAHRGEAAALAHELGAVGGSSRPVR